MLPSNYGGGRFKAQDFYSAVKNPKPFSRAIFHEISDFKYLFKMSRISESREYTHWGKNPQFIQKFTFSKYYCSQNSHFQNLIFHKIHYFKGSFFTQFTFSNSHFPQYSHFSNIKFLVISGLKNDFGPSVVQLEFLFRHWLQQLQKRIVS